MMTNEEIVEVTAAAYSNVQQAQMAAHKLECMARTVDALERIAKALELDEDEIDPAR